MGNSNIWCIGNKGKKEFAGGKNDWEKAAQVAGNCSNFSADDEDEWVADESRSCYNCRYRRWTMQSFICCKR
ncbi:hypothetical protein [Petroclostridium sp. X23]|uniref:hypothetical protein n=1 Tax=Petroclostridium sp. X23 TaxID=3045146 RepID=UPI0024ACF80E|nr:hypothetical protein [Petroclostridium sp. X23]WHH58822.1 hypothetical protein QKW49_24020 [Petroclostridium sp. X23]